NLLYADRICNFVLAVLQRDIEMLKGRGKSGIDILGLELKLQCTVCGHLFNGTLDRLDSVMPGQVRVVDYKTGSDSPEALALKKASPVFRGTDAYSNKAALQFYIYDRMAESAMSDVLKGNELVNSMYASSVIGKEIPKEYPQNETFNEEMEDELQGLFAELEDKDTGFRRNKDKCKFCDFRNLCAITDDK
ncbi:MAG: PD-(D/E)XK nuclease family protein, partial [Bacteroidales bacterium]|nr:PD-(D/E)XK nuclease family protein [Bacteroidales bacterium]